MWRSVGTHGPYYVRKQRAGGRVVQQHVGGGLVGKLAAQQDARERTERQAQAHALKQLTRTQREEDAAVTAALADVRALVAAQLLSTGHFQRKRQWRRKRDE